MEVFIFDRNSEEKLARGWRPGTRAGSESLVNGKAVERMLEL